MAGCKITFCLPNKWLIWHILEASVKQNLKKKKAVLFFGSVMYISLNMDK